MCAAGARALCGLWLHRVQPPQHRCRPSAAGVPFAPMRPDHLDQLPSRHAVYAEHDEPLLGAAAPWRDPRGQRGDVHPGAHAMHSAHLFFALSSPYPLSSRTLSPCTLSPCTHAPGALYPQAFIQITFGMTDGWWLFSMMQVRGTDNLLRISSASPPISSCRSPHLFGISHCTSIHLSLHQSLHPSLPLTALSPRRPHRPHRPG